MKNAIRAFIFITTFTIQASFAQYNVVKLDVIALAYPGLTVFRPSYERNIGKSFSWSLNFESGKYGNGTSQTVGGSATEVYLLKGWGIMPEFRIYPFNKRKLSPTGFFMGTHFRYRSLHESYSGKDFSGNSTGLVSVNTKGSLSEIGFHIGYKIRIGQFVMEPLLGYGGGFTGGFSSSERAKMDPFFAEPINISYNMLRLQFSIGFLFPRTKSKEEKSSYYAPSEPSDKWKEEDYATIYIFNSYKHKQKDISIDIYEEDSLIGKITNGSVLRYHAKSDSIIQLMTVNPDKTKPLAKFNVRKGNIYYIRCDWNEKKRSWIFKAEQAGAAKDQIKFNNQLLKQ